MIMTSHSFLSNDDVSLSDRFLEQGYITVPCEAPQILAKIKAELIVEANNWLRDSRVTGKIVELEESHHVVPISILNDFRLHLFGRLNASPMIRRDYFGLASNLIQNLVGNELAMQNKVNISIQQPQDQTSILELHSDVWSGDSPFQIVLWVPLTNSYSTNAMYLLRPELSLEAYQRAREGDLTSMKQISSEYQDDFEFVELKFGEILVFDSNCLHGNQLNTTPTTRWSLNCRIAHLLAPAITPERRLGAYYSPVMVRAATRMGMRAMNALGIIE